MYLLDTNIILELILDQEKANVVEKFLRTFPLNHLYLTDFSVHSICVILIRDKNPNILKEFLVDFFSEDGIPIIGLGSNELLDAVEAANRFKLDFDDAYQYIAAEKYNLTLISFDKDFDRTERGRKTPADILDKQ